MSKFVINYSYSRNLPIPIDEDAVKKTYNEVIEYVTSKTKCYAGQLFSVTGDTTENNGLYIAIKPGIDSAIMKLVSQEALEVVAASAGKIDKIQLNGTELTINDKTVNIDLSAYATLNYVNNEVVSAQAAASAYTDSEITKLIEVYDVKGSATSALTEAKKYVDNAINGKQDKITDLETIRSNASKGATALQSIPAEYVTETELQNKGFLTAVPSEYITATELQNKGYLTGVPSEYITESELQGKGYLTSHQDISHLATKAELTGYTTDSEFTALSNTVSQKANTSALSGYSTTGHNHDNRYYTEGEVDNKVNTLSNRITTVENYTVPDVRNKVLWIGTSIPAGDIQHGDNGTTDLGSNNYPKMIADALGFTLYNNARGSSFVCFYPPSEDGTSAWAGKDWSEYSGQVWKGYSLSASHAQIDEKFQPLGVPEWLINSFKRYSYESLIIPYIDGTIASCDTVVIDHGYNDRSIIINEASWHPGEGETQFAAGSGRQWLEDLCDPLDSKMVSETYFQGKWWNDESVSSKKHYMSAMIFLVKKIWAVNPKIKIIIGNYFATKSNVFGSEFGSDRLGEFVCLANTAIASWLRVNCVEVWKHTGIYNRNLPAGNDYQLFCPDGVHPHSDSTGHSNKIIAGVYINAIRGTLYI